MDTLRVVLNCYHQHVGGRDAGLFNDERLQDLAAFNVRLIGEIPAVHRENVKRDELQGNRAG